MKFFNENSVKKIKNHHPDHHHSFLFHLKTIHIKIV